MKAHLALLFAGAGLLVGTMPVVAHHSFAAEYDADKPIVLKGVVTKIEWMNPHARFYIDVADDGGQVTNWNLELASPNVLTRNGWKRSSLQIGDRVTVHASLAKDGSKLANARTVQLPDGRTVFAASSSGNQ